MPVEAKVLKAPHATTPRVITVVKNAADPGAFDDLKQEGRLESTYTLRQTKYLNFPHRSPQPGGQHRRPRVVYRPAVWTGYLTPPKS